MKDMNKLLTQRNDLQQTRADHLETATKAFTNGDTSGYESAMSEVKALNKQLENLNGLIAECEKAFGADFYAPVGEGDRRVTAAGGSLVDQIRSTEKYANAWLESVRKGVSIDKGHGIESLAPLYEAERACKALSIGGGDTPGEDGGFLVPLDFDNRVISLMKEYVDLSDLVTVEHVRVNSGWRVVDTAGTRTALTKIDELGRLKEGQKPSYKKVSYNCSKYGDKVIVSGELLADAQDLMNYLAAWWAPKYVMTKNQLILDKLNALVFTALAGDTDAKQVKALKSLLNTGLNTAHSKRATILTNSFGYDVMDNWVDGQGRPLLVPDPKTGDFSRFKNRPVEYADPDLISAVAVEGTSYNPIYVGNLKAFATLFLRQGTRIRATDIGGDAWDTYSTEIRCLCRMDCQTVDEGAVKRTGIKAE